MTERASGKFDYGMTALIAVVGALAFFSLRAGVASPLEAASFVTGAVCVWLTVRESVWNFPIGAANVATFFFVFLEARLFADAGLQIVYLGLALSGWYLWLRGGAARTPLQVSRSHPTQLLLLAVLGALATFVLWKLLHRYGGSASIWDALTTSMSLCAQWLINRKRVESWYLWIAVDILYIPLYVSKSLHLTAVLYAVFLVMAMLGLRAWRKQLP